LLGAGQVTPEQFNQLISQLISSTNDMCFEGKEGDISKFKELAPEQCRYWFDHLIEMIGFFKSLSMTYPNTDLQESCRQNITKYSKLLFLLKKYLLLKNEQRGLEWLQLSSEELRVALASIFQPLPQPPTARNRNKSRAENSRTIPASPSRARPESPSKGRAASPSRSRPESPSPSKGRAVQVQVEAEVEAEVEAKVHKAVVHLKHQKQKQGIIDIPKMQGHIKINKNISVSIIVSIEK